MTDASRTQFQKSVDHFAASLSGIRTGRANPVIVDEVEVDAYGAKMRIKELAAMTVPEPKVLQIEPWDKNLAKDIEKAILAANLGLTPNVSGSTIRLVLPAMTEERRKALVKQLVEATEAARVSIRKIRDDVLKELKAKKQDGTITEDQFFQKQKEIQTIVDEMNGTIKEIMEAKEKEIMTV